MPHVFANICEIRQTGKVTDEQMTRYNDYSLICPSPRAVFDRVICLGNQQNRVFERRV